MSPFLALRVERTVCPRRPESGDKRTRGPLQLDANDPIRKSGIRFCCDAQHRLPVIVSLARWRRHGRFPMRRRELTTVLVGTECVVGAGRGAQQTLSYATL